MPIGLNFVAVSQENPQDGDCISVSFVYANGKYHPISTNGENSMILFEHLQNIINSSEEEMVAHLVSPFPLVRNIAELLTKRSL